MITMYMLGLLILISNSLTVQRGKPMALVICMEMLALSSLVMWLLYLNSMLDLVSMAISFWMMFLIILGATMLLVLLSTTFSFAPHSLKMIS